MADKKISELTAAGPLSGTEVVPVVQSGVTKKTTAADIAALGGGGGAVSSVNGEMGAVVLDALEIDVASLVPSEYTPADSSVEGHLSGIDTAFSNLSDVAFSGDYSDLLNLPTLGTAADNDEGDFATSGQGTLADSAVQPEDMIYDNVYYVAKHGSDSNPDGSFSAPFLTIQKAADFIGSASNSSEFNDSSLRFFRVNVGPGVYTENVTFGTRPHIVLDLGDALVVGDITAQYDQGGTFGGTFQATHLSILGSNLRSYTASTIPRLGVEGQVILESIGSGSSLFMLLSLINTGVSSNIRKRLGSGGGTFTGQVFIDSTNVGGSVINEVGSGSTTLYAANSDTSSTQAIGGVSGAVNLNSIRNVRFNGAVVVNSAHGRWFNVEFKSGQAHDFTGSSGAISVDANSYASYFNNVPTKGSETFTFLDEARGIKTAVTATNYSAGSDNLKTHLEGVDTALGLRARRVSVPATASSTGQTGDYAVDASFAYFCIATDTWVRVAVATF